MSDCDRRDVGATGLGTISMATEGKDGTHLHSVQVAVGIDRLGPYKAVDRGCPAGFER